MLSTVYKTFFVFSMAFCLQITTSHAFSKPGPKPDLPKTAESCRQIALKIDWLGRYQDRCTCKQNLKGIDAYKASNLILNDKLKDAFEIIDAVIIRTQYAVDIGCYGQDDLKTVVASLKSIQDAIDYK